MSEHEKCLLYDTYVFGISCLQENMGSIVTWHLNDLVIMELEKND